MSGPSARLATSARRASPTKRFAMPQERAGRRGLRAGLRCAVDAGLAAVFVALMATATVEEFAHEWLGMVAFALFVAHQVLNRRWWARLLKGRYTVLRALGTAANLGLALCMLAQMASCVILSKHALGWLPAFDGAWWARVMHLLGSYWGFVLASVHAGLHLAGPARALARRGGALLWIARAAAVAVACFGAWSFVQLDFGAYLALASQFVFVDPTVPLALTAAEYASTGVLFAVIAHGVTVPLRASRRRAVARGGRSRSSGGLRGELE